MNPKPIRYHLFTPLIMSTIEFMNDTATFWPVIFVMV